ncbi:MAG: hypothetical protein ACK47B_21400 [Armatimonadota bacterium]
MSARSTLSRPRRMPSTPSSRPPLPDKGPVPSLPWALFLACAAVGVRWAYLFWTGAIYEDAFISLRYAENLAAGHGLVYNPGERVFGASTPLHVLFLAGFSRLGLDPLYWVRLLTGLADGLTLLLWARWLGGQTRSLPAVLWWSLLFGLSPVIVPVSVSGMETSFALLLLTLAFLADAADRPRALGAALGLLTLVRPEGALAGLVLLGLRWRRTGRLPWAPALLAAVLVAPWVIPATLYYGSPVPHSIPAKAAAYNLHRPSHWPNVQDTLAQVLPAHLPAGRLLALALLAPCLMAGLRAGWRTPARPLVLLLGVWWAYLVLPKTLLFVWYFPLLLLPAYVLSALGFASLHRLAQDRLRPGTARAASAGVLALFALGLVAWLLPTAADSRRQQEGETSVRREIGLWLRERTPPGARVAMEPIGYVGYYSQRPVLDEVGLVSPEMVPLNRRGGGWFGEMLRQLEPPYVVERPYFLLRNLTINSRVPMFADEAERTEFARRYRARATFSGLDLPAHLRKDFRFAVYSRRSEAELREWDQEWARLSAAEREERVRRAISGEAAAAPAPPPPP